MRKLCAAVLALMVLLGAQVAHASPEIAVPAPPREITVQDYIVWHRALAAKLEAVLTAYEGSLKAYAEHRLTQDQFRQRLMELSIAAAEVLRDSTSVTSTKNAELWGRITGDAALVAMVYSDIVLNFGRYAGGAAAGGGAADGGEAGGNTSAGNAAGGTAAGGNASPGNAAPGESRLNAACDLLRQAVAMITGRDVAAGVRAGGTGPVGSAVAETVAGNPATPEAALFSHYFKDLSVGRLPVEVTKQDKATWRDHIIQTNMFSYGDIFAMTGEVLKEVRLTIAYVDVNSGKTVGSAGETPPLKPGPFSGFNVMALPPGNYEVRCFIDGTLVRVLPFSALSPGSRVSM